MSLSRRKFLKAPLAAAIGPRGALAFGRLIVPHGATGAVQEELFPNPLRIHYDSSCFTINSRDTMIVGGAFHYPRTPRQLWRDRLEKFKAAGFNTIETYVFWNYHEPVEGRADLAEFEAFVKLVHEMGFWMIARPGPYVCAEWERGGFPEWVVAKRFPLRSDHPESLRTSEHWFSLVLPIIQKNQIVTGGPIIMVQIENEYDYYNAVAEPGKLAYTRALARMCWDAGIQVPLITCWTQQARENSDPAMARVMDTCNFYPRWNVAAEAIPALEKLRREEPSSPVAVTELQGGWFSEFGGKLSVEQDGVSGAQFDLLAKTVLEQGVTYFNAYMGAGGTNFDWAAKRMTTTYDYAAPIREPGGLWEKYYAARGLGASLGLLSGVLPRAVKTAAGVQSSNPAVVVTLRESGKAGALFLRENANRQQRFKASFPDPHSPTRRVISIPREGELVLGAREAKLLPVQLPVPGGQVRYSTAQVLAAGVFIDREYLLVYDEPGRPVEISLATRDEPHVEGDTTYRYWDPEFESVVFGFVMGRTEKIFLLNEHQFIVALPRERALKTWTAEFPPAVIPGAEEKTPMSISFFSDAARLAASGAGKKGIWAELELPAGEHDLNFLAPPKPSRCLVFGLPAEIEYDRPHRMAHVHITNPPPQVSAVEIKEVEAGVEKFDAASGEWAAQPLAPLGEAGPLPYGYVKYAAEFTPRALNEKVFASAFADDGKKIFLNGKLIPEASLARRETEFALESYAHTGTNRLEISYELFGSPNFGREIGEPKGLERVRIGKDAASAAPVEGWKVQRFPAPMRGRQADMESLHARLEKVQLGARASLGPPVPAFTWCRAEFELGRIPEGWTIPWRLTFEAERDALLYLNGRFVGRYVIVGPQRDFYLPEPFLNADPRRRNVLIAVIAYTETPAAIRTMRVAPYEEFTVRRTRVDIEW